MPAELERVPCQWYNLIDSYGVQLNILRVPDSCPFLHPRQIVWVRGSRLSRVPVVVADANVAIEGVRGYSYAVFQASLTGLSRTSNRTMLVQDRCTVTHMGNPQRNSARIGPQQLLCTVSQHDISISALMRWVRSLQTHLSSFGTARQRCAAVPSAGHASKTAVVH